ncbi:ATP-binding cassette domain-containing protein, partial [Mycobacterium tuberculosis]|nr:ATP-binding cassette domain-containing protein [Mycobacterium tuberculosis]
HPTAARRRQGARRHLRPPRRLLKCLMGVLPIKSGQILLDGKDISKLSPENRVRAGMAYVPQGRDIFSTLTVEENILIGMAKFKGSKAKKV